MMVTYFWLQVKRRISGETSNLANLSTLLLLNLF
jgi:hypothetical protein